jgi:uncharacterized protein (TIGR04255 family)
MVQIPRKLKNDPIVEALLEVRFAASEIREVVVGKLASCESWREFAGQRLPLADMPGAIRDHDPGLAYQPVLQLQRRDGTRLIKIGPRVLSYHALPPYPGWAIFEPELSSSAEYVFAALRDAMATRFGFRYINVLTRSHLIESVADLNIDVSLAKQPLTAPLNLNYQRVLAPNHHSIVRVASIARRALAPASRMPGASCALAN